MTDDQLRDRAVHRLKAKQAFWTLFFTWVALSVFFTVIWLVTGGPSANFWPVWPIAGIGIAVVFSAINTFGGGAGGPSEAKIQGEIDKLKGS